MRTQGTYLLVLGLLVAGTGAYANEALFSGTQTDTAPLPYVNYDQCSFVLEAGYYTSVSFAADHYPLISDDSGTITVDLVSDASISDTDYAGLYIDVRKDPFDLQGTVEVQIKGDGLDVVVLDSSGDEKSRSAVSGIASPTSIAVTITAASIAVDLGTGSDKVKTWADVNTDLGGILALDGSEFVDVGLAVNSADGPDWEFDEVTWTSDAIANMNQTGTPCSVEAVPDVVGATKTAAEAAIQAAGLAVGTLTTEFNDLIPLDEVISQNPAAGSFVLDGSLVSLVVSGGDIDSDNDGLPNQWEMDYFNTLEFWAGDDPDGDGANNRKEFSDGTDPMDPASMLPAMGHIGMALLGVICAALAIYAIRKKSGTHVL